MKNLTTLRNASMTSRIAPYLSDLNTVIGACPSNPRMGAAPTLTMNVLVSTYRPCSDGQSRLVSGSDKLGHALDKKADQISLSFLLRATTLSDAQYILTRRAEWRSASLQYALLDVVALVLKLRPTSGGIDLFNLVERMRSARAAHTSPEWVENTSFAAEAHAMWSSLSSGGVAEIASAIRRIAMPEAHVEQIISKIGMYLGGQGVTNAGGLVALVAEALDIREKKAVGVQPTRVIVGAAGEFEVYGYVDGVPQLRKIAPAREPKTGEVWKHVGPGEKNGVIYHVINLLGTDLRFANLISGQVWSFDSLMGKTMILADWEFYADSPEAAFDKKRRQ